MNWTRVEDGIPPMPPHSHDGATERVMVWVEKTYYPHVYFGCYEFTEDGSDWEIDGLHHLHREDWKVTHWAKEPERPENGQICTDHAWEDTGGQLMGWPPIKVYVCARCQLTGNLRGYLSSPSSTKPYYHDFSGMEYEGKP